MRATRWIGRLLRGCMALHHRFGAEAFTSPQPGWAFEPLERRVLLTAVPHGGLLIITGTDADDRIEVAPGLNDGEVIVLRAPGVEDNTLFVGVDLISVDALGGNDKITILPGLLSTLSTGIITTLIGGSGNDEINGGDSDDMIFGDDMLLGGDGDDKIVDLLGHNTIDAGDGDNRIETGDGDDIVLTGSGKDRITDAGGTNIIGAGAGDDRVTSGDGDDTITTGDGRDRVTDSAGSNVIDTGADDDQVTTGGGDDNITTGDGDDRVTDTGGTNTIDAGAGDDRVTTGEGDDTLFTGDGDDRVADRGGVNTVDTGNGDDRVATGDGDDAISTGDGDDRIADRGGVNAIDTGTGDDRVATGLGDDFVELAEGDDRFSTRGGSNTVRGGDGEDNIRGGNGDDDLEGGDGDDRIDGKRGDDRIRGGDGSDKIKSNLSAADDISDEPPSVVTETENNDKQRRADLFGLGGDGAVQIAGISDNGDDDDYFTFTAEVDATLQFIVMAPVGGNFAKLRLSEVIAGMEEDIVETDPNDGTFDAEAEVLAGHTYLVRMRSSNDDPADYVVNISSGGTGGAGGDGSEPANVVAETESNDVKAAADLAPLGTDGIVQLTGSSLNPDEKDFFRFQAQSSGMLNVLVTNVSGLAEVDVETADGEKVLETDPDDGMNSASGSVVAGVTYFIRVRADGDLAADYTVDLTLT